MTVAAVAAVVDDTAARALAVVLSSRLPAGLAVDPAAVAAGGWIVVGCAALAVPAAYVTAATRIGRYRV